MKLFFFMNIIHYVEPELPTENFWYTVRNGAKTEMQQLLVFQRQSIALSNEVYTRTVCELKVYQFSSKRFEEILFHLPIIVLIYWQASFYK